MTEADKRPRLLLVDSDPIQLMRLRNQLASDHHLAFAKTGERAMALAAQQVPDLVLVSVGAQDLNGYDTCKALKALPGMAQVPVILVTESGEAADEAAGFAAGAVDFITRPYPPALLRSRVLMHLSLRRVDELRSTQRQVVQCLALAAEYKDNESGLHVIRISHYARILGEALGWSASDVEDLFSAAPLHDVGKIGIPDAILQKPGLLSADEITIMRQHAEIGTRIIGQHEQGMLAMASRIALSHHEKWDGTGYPLRLKGESIPIEARIVAIADVFDALTSDRPYKKAWSVEDAVAFLQREAGNHFDPALVALFVQHLPKILEVRARWAEDATVLDN